MNRRRTVKRWSRMKKRDRRIHIEEEEIEKHVNGGKEQGRARSWINRTVNRERKMKKRDRRVNGEEGEEKLMAKRTGKS